RAAPPLGDAEGLPRLRHRVRLPPAPRHLVLGAAVTAQLVAADLRDGAGERARLPCALLERGPEERLAPLQLLSLERREPRQRGAARPVGHPRPAAAGG